MTTGSIVIRYREKGGESIAIVEEGDEREEIIEPDIYELIESVQAWILWNGGKVLSVEIEARITFDEG